MTPRRRKPNLSALRNIQPPSNGGISRKPPPSTSPIKPSFTPSSLLSNFSRGKSQGALQALTARGVYNVYYGLHTRSAPAHIYSPRAEAKVSSSAAAAAPVAFYKTIIHSARVIAPRYYYYASRGHGGSCLS